MQSEANVDAHVTQLIYQRLRNACPLPGFTYHEIRSHVGVDGLIGNPDFVAIGRKPDGSEQLLFVAESKTKNSFPVPDGMTTAEAWQDADLQNAHFQGDVPDLRIHGEAPADLRHAHHRREIRVLAPQRQLCRGCRRLLQQQGSHSCGSSPSPAEEVSCGLKGRAIESHNSPFVCLPFLLVSIRIPLVMADLLEILTNL